MFHDYIETIFRHGITGGCGIGIYCPDNFISRAEMAVFLLKAKFGSTHVPPGATGAVFNDVHKGDFAADWIEQLYNEGITGGCGGGKYCPNDPVTRAQMAVFLLKTRNGLSYASPTCTGLFDDVECQPAPAFAVDWIEQLYNEGITEGCGTSPLIYCPASPATRGQMAVFLVKTFNLQSALAPLPSITFSISPYSHNMSIGECVYSGTFCVHAQQWGAYAVDTTKSNWAVSGGMVSPVTSKTGSSFQPPALTKCAGDFHQSVQSVAASAGSPKWVVSTIGSLGTHYACTPVGNPFKVQVYSLSTATGLKYVGQAFVDSLGDGDVIIGDTAYIEKGNGTFVPVDLNSCFNNGPTNGCTVGPAVSSIPAHATQDDIGGFTYNLTSNPDQSLNLVRDGNPANAPPVASATMTNLSAASRQGAEKTKNYFGDVWRIQDGSSAFPPVDDIKWDIHLPNGTVANYFADPAWSGPPAGLSVTRGRFSGLW